VSCGFLVRRGRRRDQAWDQAKDDQAGKAVGELPDMVDIGNA
jgi:hypothetical protein